MTAWILGLTEPACQERALTGGKAASLAALANDYRVPAGFAITAGAHAAAQNGQQAALRQLIDVAYEQLAQSGLASPVAVRSSAIDEDGRQTSFAGIHESYLNCRGTEAVWRAVEACWRSALSERALAYRRQNGLPTESIRMGVLVQTLVPADVSAVAFSYDPVARTAGSIVINANWGLGESIVGGTVTPDTHRLNKADLQPGQQLIARKERMTITREGGTVEVTVPGLMQTQPCLTPGQVAAIGRLTRDLEQRYGWPVDVECAFAGDELYLLQCRPVTGI